MTELAQPPVATRQPSRWSLAALSAGQILNWGILYYAPVVEHRVSTVVRTRRFWVLVGTMSLITTSLYAVTLAIIPLFTEKGMSYGVAALALGLVGAGQVIGLDVEWFEECGFGPAQPDVPAVRIDIRDVRPEDLRGVDAVIHLAALSNDPLGDLDPALTREINHVASMRLAAAAKEAGIRRFLFSSSCSLYGSSGDAALTETAAFRR